MIILNFLKEKDYYTYELNKALSEYVDVNESTAYAIFKKLINNGLCESYLKPSESGPARKYYKITEKGKEELIEYKKTWSEFKNKVDEIIN